MLQLLSAWRTVQWPIIHVKHRSPEPDSVFWPGQQGFEFKPNFLPQGDELVIEKNIPCALLNTNLEQILNQQNIQKTVLIGAATNNSIEATARTANGLGFRVLVVEEPVSPSRKKIILARREPQQRCMQCHWQTCTMNMHRLWVLHNYSGS